MSIGLILDCTCTLVVKMMDNMMDKRSFWLSMETNQSSPASQSSKDGTPQVRRFNASLAGASSIDIALPAAICFPSASWAPVSPQALRAILLGSWRRLGR